MRGSLFLVIGLAAIGCGTQFGGFSGSSSGTGPSSSGTGPSSSGTESTGASTTTTGSGGAGGKGSGGAGGAGTGGSAATSSGSTGGGSSTSSASTNSASTSSASTSSASTSSASGSGGGGVDAGPLGPTVNIFHPGTGENRKQNVPIFFHEVSTDPTDGPLSGSALVWTDSLEGQFGTGNDFMWPPTVLGMHVITLKGTDSLNYSATDSITLNIIP